jgi:hypothetical protein
MIPSRRSDANGRPESPPRGWGEGHVFYKRRPRPSRASQSEASTADASLGRELDPRGEGAIDSLAEGKTLLPFR